MERMGTLLVFKPGTSVEDVNIAIRSIANVLDPNYFIKRSEKMRWKPTPGDLDRLVLAPDGDSVLATVEHFDDTYGGPTFYIP